MFLENNDSIKQCNWLLIAERNGTGRSINRMQELNRRGKRNDRHENKYRRHNRATFSSIDE